MWRLRNSHRAGSFNRIARLALCALARCIGAEMPFISSGFVFLAKRENRVSGVGATRFFHVLVLFPR